MPSPAPRLALSVAASLAALALAAASLAARAADPGPSPEEKQLLAKVSAEWTELGKSCLAKKLGPEARLCAARARATDPDSAAAKKLEESAASGESDPSEAAHKEGEKRLAATGKKVAAIYDKLVLGLAKVTDAKTVERSDGYFLAALEADDDPKRWERALAFIESTAGGKEAARGARLAEKALALKPAEKLVPRLKQVAELAAIDHVVLRTATKHPLAYYLSLPTGYSHRKGKKWPVLVCVDGAGSNFEGIGQSYTGARKTLPLIVVSPCTFAKTNQIVGNDGLTARYKKYYTDEVIKAGDQRRLDWDEEGILAALEDVREQFDGEPRCYVTGFSGGGNATYMMVMKHPDLVNAAAPACANFFHRDYAQSQKGKFQGEDLAIGIHQITGEKDENRTWTFGKESGGPGIDPQTEWAKKALDDLGYSNVAHTQVPGMGHSPAVAEVLETFRPYIEGTKKRGDKVK